MEALTGSATAEAETADVDAGEGETLRLIATPGLRPRRKTLATASGPSQTTK